VSARVAERRLLTTAVATVALLGACSHPPRSDTPATTTGAPPVTASNGTTSAGSTSSPAAIPADDPADRSTKVDLRNAFVAAKVFFYDNGTYTGFDPGRAAEIEPSLHWAIHGAAAPGRITIDLADGPELVLSELSASGTAFCIGDSPSGTIGGTRDGAGATSSADCSDDAGWVEPTAEVT